LDFAKRNATLVLWDINEEQNKKTLDKLHSINYYDVHLYTVDVSSKTELETTALKVKEQVGQVYLVIMAGNLYLNFFL
jgi:all-trans-retinol dehydrogenase (NAD+)